MARGDRKQERTALELLDRVRKSPETVLNGWMTEVDDRQAQ
jgi:hypothetical protein